MSSALEIFIDETQSSYRRRQALTDLCDQPHLQPQAAQVLQHIFTSDQTMLQRELLSSLKSAKAAPFLPQLRFLLEHIKDDYLLRDVVETLAFCGESEDLVRLQYLVDNSSFSLSYAAKKALAELEKRCPVENEVPAQADAEEASGVTAQAEENAMEAVEEAAAIERSTAAEAKAEMEASEVKMAEEIAASEARNTADLEAAEAKMAAEIAAAEAQSAAEIAAVKAEVAARIEAVEEQMEAAEEEAKVAEAEVLPKSFEQSNLPNSPDSSSLLSEVKQAVVAEVLKGTLFENSVFDGADVGALVNKLESESDLPLSAHAPSLHPLGEMVANDVFLAFFAEANELAQNLYSELNLVLQSLPEQEEQHSALQRELMLLQADRLDDIQDAQQEVAEVKNLLSESKRERKKCRELIKQLEDDQSNLWNSLIGAFNSVGGEEREVELKQQRKNSQRLQRERKEIAEQVEQKESQLLALRAPLLALEEKIEAAAENLQKLQLDAVRVEKQLNELYRSSLFSLGEEQWQQILKKIPQESAQFLGKQSWRELASLTVRIRSAEEEYLQQQAEQDQAFETQIDSMSALGESLQNSFTLKTTRRSAKSRLRGGLRFEEERSFFSFSGASGAASGSGSSEVEMEITEPIWDAEPELGGKIQNWQNSLQNLGEQNASMELKRIYVQQLQAELQQQLDFFRFHFESQICLSIKQARSSK